jgi:type IV secretory pathway VirB10-like protein
MESELDRKLPLLPDASYDDEMPIVASRCSPWPLAFAFVGALGVGGLVFMQLSTGRMQSEAQHTRSEVTAQLASSEMPAKVRRVVYPDPPAEEVDSEPQDDVELTEEFIDVLEPETPAFPETDHLRAPVLVVDLSQPVDPEQKEGRTGDSLDARSVTESMTGAANAGAQLNADERFASRLGVSREGGEVSAKHLGDLSTTIIQGEVIPAVLDTALNSDLPGYARATVTRDVRGFDGSSILVPSGSRLIGQYRSGVALGQSRAFLIWTRLIRPDGASIDLAAPATDGLGRGGLTGEVDHPFLERFGGGILLSLLNIGANAITDSSDTNIVIASGQSGNGTAGAAMNSSASIGPTVKVPQGTPVRVFVNQDLDFSPVGAAEPDRPPT